MTGNGANGSGSNSLFGGGGGFSLANGGVSGAASFGNLIGGGGGGYTGGNGGIGYEAGGSGLGGLGGTSFNAGLNTRFSSAISLGNGSVVITDLTPPATTVPEPASLAILGASVAGVAALRRRKSA